jgi:hypothetical protein
MGAKPDRVGDFGPALGADDHAGLVMDHQVAHVRDEVESVGKDEHGVLPVTERIDEQQQ